MAKSLASDEPCAALASRLFLQLQDISPSTIFAILSSLALYYYRRQPIYIRRSPLLWAKVVSLSRCVPSAHRTNLHGLIVCRDLPMSR